MKQKLPAVLFISIVLFGGIFLFFSKQQSPSLKQAQQAERIGDLEKACVAYADAIYSITPATSLPNVNRSKFVTHEVLKKDVEKYIRSLGTNHIGKKSALSTAVAGLFRCQCMGKSPVSCTDPKVTPYTDSTFFRAWNTTFFAPKVKPDPSHRSLASGNFTRNLSLLKLSCEKNYSYECLLLNKVTLQATRCLLPSENSAHLYALPGEYLLICRSSVTFPNGEIWRSPFAALPITVPQASSEVATELRTNVIRK